MKKSLFVVEISDSWMFLTNKKQLWHELMEEWITMWTLCPVVLIPLYAILKDDLLIYRILALILPVWIMTIIRRRIKALSLFLLLNFLCAAAAYFIGQSLFEKAIYVLLMLIFFGSSVKKRYSEVVNFYGMTNFMFCEGLLSLSYIITYSFGLNTNVRFIAVGGIVVALSSVLYIHLTRTEKLMEWEKEFAQKFTKRLKKIKMLFSSVVIVIISAVIWLMWQSGIFQMLDRLQSYINSLFSANPQKKVTPPPQPKQPPKAQNDGMEALRNLGGDSSPNIIVEIIMKIVEVIIIIVVVIIIIYLLWMLILKLRELYQQFYLRGPKNENREFILTAEDFTKNITTRLEKGKREISNLFDRSTRKRIRKMYHKIIEKYRGQGIDISQSNTPEEMNKKIIKGKSKDIGRAVEIYDKARYSDQSCSEQDLEEIKQYL